VAQEWKTMEPITTLLSSAAQTKIPAWHPLSVVVTSLQWCHNLSHQLLRRVWVKPQPCKSTLAATNWPVIFYNTLCSTEKTKCFELTRPKGNLGRRAVAHIPVRSAPMMLSVARYSSACKQCRYPWEPASCANSQLR
jgi:hypothetical protein